MIDWPRDVLYERINKRVDQMVASGLINEVSGLMKTVEKGETTSYQLKGNIAMRDAIINLKTATRNYAKRQLTWFRRDKRVIALNMENETLQSLAERIAEDIQNPKEYSK